jgi:uncharacterized protein YggE
MIAAAQASDPCAQAPTTCATLINTHATSRTRIPNTVVDVSLTITFNDKDLPTVQRTIGTKSTSLLGYLRAQQVQRLITTSVSFEPENRFKSGSLDKIIGYVGVLKVSFRATPDKTPDLLVGVLANGASSVDRVTFTPTEEEIAAARRQLLSDATKVALSQADSIAVAAGLKVISVRQINVENEGAAIQLYGLATNGFSGYEDKARTRSPVQVDPDTSAGDQTLSITVNLVAAASHE